MSQFTYNPNDFSPISNDMNQYQQSSHSNYKDDIDMNYNMRQPDMRQPDMRQYDTRQYDTRHYDTRQYDMREPDIIPQYDMKNSNTYYSPKKRYENMSNYKKEKYESFNESRFNLSSIVKKIIVYTILFLIMSHIKMNNLLCNFIPFVENNEIACMVTKGFIMSCIIIILYPLL